MENHRCPVCGNPADQPVCPVCGWGEEQGNEPHQLQPGTVLRGQYVIGRALGQGGFGITYLGWDRELERKVAIKEFFPNSLVTRNTERSTAVQLYDDNTLARYEASRTRFLREAQALARFSNVPEIVGIYGCFEQNNTAYIVMEYIKGSNLVQYMEFRGGPLSVEETLRILKPVMAALDTVHKAGFVHRDISPDNIILDPMGGAKLLDFGAVRAVENPEADKDMTRSTEAIVKHGFAPMEQYRSRGGIGPWTDEYALCATIYYCLTRQIPPDAPSRATGEPGPNWNGIPQLKPHQRAALEKGMSLAAGDRYPTVGELSRALFAGKSKAAPEPGEHASRPEKPRRKPGPRRAGYGRWIAAAAAILAALAAGVWLWRSQGSEPPKGRDPGGGSGSAAMESAPAPSEAPDIPPTSAEAPDISFAPEETSGTEPSRETFIMAPSDDFQEINQAEWENQPIWGQTKYLRGDVRTIRFHSTLEGVPAKAWDVSEAKDASILAWMDGSDLHVAANGTIAPNPNAAWMFAYFTSLETIDFGGCFDTANVTNMGRMFYGCKNLTALDISGFDTANVTDMNTMFRDCMGLKALDVSGFDTSRVTTMYCMFSTCTSLVKLDLSGFDTSRVTNMGYMFSACRSLEEVEVSGFNTSIVFNMEGMFRWCGVLREPDLSGWDVSRVVTYSNFMNDGMTINGRPWQEFFR